MPLGSQHPGGEFSPSTPAEFGAESVMPTPSAASPLLQLANAADLMRNWPQPNQQYTMVHSHRPPQEPQPPRVELAQDVCYAPVQQVEIAAPQPVLMNELAKLDCKSVGSNLEGITERVHSVSLADHLPQGLAQHMQHPMQQGQPSAQAPCVTTSMPAGSKRSLAFRSDLTFTEYENKYGPAAKCKTGPCADDCSTPCKHHTCTCCKKNRRIAGAPATKAWCGPCSRREKVDGLEFVKCGHMQTIDGVQILCGVEMLPEAFENHWKQHKKDLVPDAVPVSLAVETTEGRKCGACTNMRPVTFYPSQDTNVSCNHCQAVKGKSKRANAALQQKGRATSPTLSPGHTMPIIPGGPMQHMISPHTGTPGSIGGYNKFNTSNPATPMTNPDPHTNSINRLSSSSITTSIVSGSLPNLPSPDAQHAQQQQQQRLVSQSAPVNAIQYLAMTVPSMDPGRPGSNNSTSSTQQVISVAPPTPSDPNQAQQQVHRLLPVPASSNPPASPTQTHGLTHLIPLTIPPLEEQKLSPLQSPSTAPSTTTTTTNIPTLVRTTSGQFVQVHLSNSMDQLVFNQLASQQQVSQQQQAGQARPYIQSSSLPLPDTNSQKPVQSALMSPSSSIPQQVKSLSVPTPPVDTFAHVAAAARNNTNTCNSDQLNNPEPSFQLTNELSMMMPHQNPPPQLTSQGVTRTVTSTAAAFSFMNPKMQQVDQLKQTQTMLSRILLDVKGMRHSFGGLVDQWKRLRNAPDRAVMQEDLVRIIQLSMEVGKELSQMVSQDAEPLAKLTPGGSTSIRQ